MTATRFPVLLAVFLMQAVAEKALKENAARKLCDKYSAITGVWFRPHTLRHSVAHQYLMGGANDLVGVSTLLGHESLKKT